jgi:hypothetical protein
MRREGLPKYARSTTFCQGTGKIYQMCPILFDRDGDKHYAAGVAQRIDTTAFSIGP